MTRNRSVRALASLGLITILALTMAGPAAILGATPNWEEVGNQALPTAVTPGAEAGYSLSIKNAGPSNISQLYLVTADGSPAPTYTAPSQGSCTYTTRTICSFGALRKGRTASIVIAFATPASGANSFSMAFAWNTTGLGAGESDNSHGDDLDQIGTTLLVDDDNFEGGFVRTPGELGNASGLSASNQQSTKVIVPASNIPVTVADESAVIGDASCPAELECSTLTSELNVNSGAPFPNGFKAIIGFDSSQLESGTNANNLDFWHLFDDGINGELITDACMFTGGNPVPKNMPCVDVANAGGGDLIATFWLTQNGRIQGW
jgi:hypothetical protein